MRPRDLLLITAKFLRGWETICQLPSTFVRSGHFPSSYASLLCGQNIFRHLTSTFLPPGTVCNLPSTLCAAGRTSVNFRQLSIRPGDLPSTFVNITCRHLTLSQLPMRPGDLKSTSANFLCGRETFLRHPSNFLLGQENFCKLQSTFINFRLVGRPSVNFLCHRENFC